MKKSTPKLPLTSEERMNLRKCKVKLNEIALMDIQQLTACLQSTYERAKYLRGLAQFQAIPSIGPKLAQWVTELGYYSLEELKNEDGADLTNRLEEQFGYWEDPCVEDSLRCIVHHANYSNSEKSWWHFTDERKQYRELNGYPDSRPTTPWHDKKAKS
ncbi:MAG: helix-hairpin-helix domain-containing protein [Solibacillus sp.]|uniref:helix-hairpin-helix domain-containing protein n=1 Tax=Solibacillus sp. TaxID=1909654 RepID=UPI0033147BB1